MTLFDQTEEQFTPGMATEMSCSLVAYVESPIHAPFVVVMFAVKSSNVSHVGLTQDGNMIVLFASGSMYMYHNVGAAKFLRVMDADSVGREMNESIKPIHRCVQVG